MPSRRQGASSTSNEDIHSFLSDVIGDGYRKIEEDLGKGYVRLCASEADRRQAAQDIRSSEDILIEMLRNSRDAGAKNIFVATQKVADARTIIIVDDGSGIPEEMHSRIFQPRVTSKLDSAHLDRWGMHGRGMALFSISENAKQAKVAHSREGAGASLLVETDTSKLGEKRDQSTFPRFELVDGVHSMRGPKNMLRTAAEFAIEHEGELSVYCGSPTEVLATMWHHGIDTVPASKRAFGIDEDLLTLPQALSICVDIDELADMANRFGMPISKRSARRIMDGDIERLPSMMDRVREESFSKPASSKNQQTDPYVNQDRANGSSCQPTSSSSQHMGQRKVRTKVSRCDLDEVARDVQGAFSALAQRYYLENMPVEVKQRDGRIVVEFEMVESS